MAGTRNQERDELHKTIWRIANDLRGSVDGWDFKQYVLGILFYRYLSEDLTAFINKDEADDFDYSELDDSKVDDAVRKDIINTRGLFIYPSELFGNVLTKAISDKGANLNVKLAEIFRNIETSAAGTEAETKFKGLFSDLDTDSNRLGGAVDDRNKNLLALLNGIASMQLGSIQNNVNDVFGDAFEYLMSMYASNAGKSGGEFYTPQEVSELLTKIVMLGKSKVNKVYDPACGSGSLLLNFAKHFGLDSVRLGYFGQEINITTYNLCRINMFLHGIEFTQFDIAHGDTLINPKHGAVDSDPNHNYTEPFEAIVSNPPYSVKWIGDGDPVLTQDPRFASAGVLAPKSKADLAFVMHSLSWLAPNGAAAIVCFPGIMYRSGAEQKIRQYLVDNNFVDCVIQLPDNLFFGTSIATCIMVLKKSKTEPKTLFIDASKEFEKDTNSNRLSEINISNILEYYAGRKDVNYKAKLVDNNAVAEQGYNLSVSTYVEAEDTREKIDIDVLNAEIKKIVKREDKLRKEIDAIIAEIEGGVSL
jgi:type I restriction enzyme M protein